MGALAQQYDYAGTVVAVILNWVRDAGKIREHHCDLLRKVYSADRSEIIWTPAGVAKFNTKAPEWVQRILAVALETGLRPGDLIKLGWQHIEATPHGRRIKNRTAKRAGWRPFPSRPGWRAS